MLKISYAAFGNIPATFPTASNRPILLSRNRARAGFTAPAKGLTLNRVFY